MWDRWQKGDSLNNISRLFDRNHSSISGILSLTGGIRPPKRTRSSQALSLSEREEISRGVASHYVRLHIDWGVRHLPSAVKLNAIMVINKIEPHKQIRPHGLVHGVQSDV